MNSFMAGFGVGLALGLLFAPHSGRTVRKLIRKGSDELRESALDVVDRGRGVLSRQVERFATPPSSGLEVYQR